jgi:hypothetical protein
MIEQTEAMQVLLDACPSFADSWCAQRLHVEGSPWVREFATIGILEGIQNVWSHSAIDPDVFFPFLGSESQRWWKGLNAFWQGGVPPVRALD